MRKSQFRHGSLCFAHAEVTRRLNVARTTLEAVDREYNLTAAERRFYARMLLDRVIEGIWDSIGDGTLSPYGSDGPEVYLPPPTFPGLVR